MKKCPACKIMVDVLEVSITLTQQQLLLHSEAKTTIKIGYACCKCGVLFIDLPERPIKTIYIK